MWPRRQKTFRCLTQAHRAVPSWWALLCVGAGVLMLSATAERRNLFFRFDLGLPWIRTLGLPRLSR